MQIYGIVPESVVDGPGWRTAIFCQGCFHNCEGCHNPNSHDPNGGKHMEVQEIVNLFEPHIDGITLTGGEPFEQASDCATLAKEAHKQGLNVWCYTGYLYDDLLCLTILNPQIDLLLSEIDVLVDGPFILAQRSLDLLYKGSKNQRIINVPKSLACGEVVLWEELS